MIHAKPAIHGFSLDSVSFFGDLSFRVGQIIYGHMNVDPYMCVYINIYKYVIYIYIYSCVLVFLRACYNKKANPKKRSGFTHSKGRMVFPNATKNAVPRILCHAWGPRLQSFRST